MREWPRQDGSTTSAERTVIEDPRRQGLRMKVIGCATIMEEVLPLMPPDMACEILEYGLHVRPDGLRDRLQAAIDRAGRDHDVVLLAYGMCSMAAVGLEATGCTVVLPRVDNCIACFVGSQDEYRRRAEDAPGTYYLTKGWIEVGDTLLDEYRRVVRVYGEEKAERIMRSTLDRYDSLVFIDTGHEDQERYRTSARSIAQRFGLEYREIPGSLRLVHKLLNGPWDDEFVVAPPGTTIGYLDF